MKTEIFALNTCKFLTQEAAYQMPCVPEMKGFIVVIAETLQLTFHSLDSDFENKLFLSQQPFHHRAKLP